MSRSAISGSASHKGGVIGKIDSANYTIEGNKFNAARYGIGYDASGMPGNEGCEKIGSPITILTTSPLPSAFAGTFYSQTLSTDAESFEVVT